MNKPYLLNSDSRNRAYSLCILHSFYTTNYDGAVDCSNFEKK